MNLTSHYKLGKFRHQSNNVSCRIKYYGEMKWVGYFLGVDVRSLDVIAVHYSNSTAGCEANLFCCYNHCFLDRNWWLMRSFTQITTTSSLFNSNSRLLVYYFVSLVNNTVECGSIIRWIYYFVGINNNEKL